MYAIIETGGKQYRVKPGDIINVEKLDVQPGDEISFDKVLIMGDGENAEIGTPYLDAVVKGRAVENGKGKKVIIYKYKAKKDYRKKQGHRQPFTKVEIVEVGGEKAPEPEEAPAEDETAADVSDAAADAPEEQDVTAEASDAGEEVIAEAADTEAADTETADGEEESSGVSMSMKKDELISYAEEQGIEIDPRATKQEIIDTINENM